MTIVSLIGCQLLVPYINSLSGCQPLSVGVSFCPSLSVGVIGCQWVSLVVFGFHWLSVVVSGCQWLSVVVSGCQWVSDSVGVIQCVPVSAAASQCQKQPLFVDQRNLRKLNFSTLPPAAWLGRPPLRKTETFVESRRCVTTSPDAFCCILLHGKCTPIIVMSGEGEEGEEGGKLKDFFVLSAMRALLRPDLAFSLW